MNCHNELSMLETYNIAPKYVKCISESYLDSTAPLYDNSLSQNGYNLSYNAQTILITLKEEVFVYNTMVFV